MENGRLLLLGNIFSKSYQLPVGQRWGQVRASRAMAGARK